MQELTSVEYQSFIDHLETGLISDVSIYNFTSAVDITYKFNGVGYATQGPWGASRDTLLHRTLDTKSIKFTLLDQEYDGPGLSSHKFSEYSSLVFLVVPVLLIVVILVQAQTIRKLTNKLPNIAGDA